MRLRKRSLGAVAALAAIGLLAACGESPEGGEGGKIELKITMNADPGEGGKNAASAQHFRDWVIPEFEKAQKAKGKDVKVTFIPDGAEDNQYKSKLALSLKSGGADVMDIDGIWLGEFAEAGLVKPLAEQVPAAEKWDGWAQIPEAVQGLATYQGKKYALPIGTDGRVIFFNKKLFKQAGLPEDWQPKSWKEIIDAGNALKKLDGVTPIQLNAGKVMEEATTMQGLLPLLAGNGGEVWKDGAWTGGTPEMQGALGFYQQVYGGGLGDAQLQNEAKGRDKSFERFSEGKVGMLFEGDYFWRGVLDPKEGTAKMKDRDETVGYAKIPAAEPGKGLGGQDFVSMSGGAVRMLNPRTEHPEEAFELLAFTLSAEALKKETVGNVRITPREDVNSEILADDPLLTYISEEVLPITSFRPPVKTYNDVSVLLQEATGAVASGKMTPQEAAADFQKKVAEIEG